MRYLGEKILEQVGEEQSMRWVIDQVMEIEAPEATRALRKNLDGLMPATKTDEGGD